MKTLRPNIMFVSLFLIVLCVVLTPFQAVWAADTFTMAFPGDPKNEPLLKFVELVYTDAFQRLGLEFHYEMYPYKRCGVIANAGEADGEPGRVATYAQTFPNLIWVEEPIVIINFVAFATDPTIRLSGWESLKNSSYTVDFITGTTAPETNLSTVVQPDRLSSVPTIEQALKKLRAGRTDIFIHVENMVLPVLQEAFPDSGIVKVGLMQDASLYPFLHKKHADLAPKLAEVMKHMKAEGLFEQYMQQTR